MSVKPELVVADGQAIDLTTPSSATPLPDGLIGDRNECSILLEGNSIRVLLDSGSQVSTLSEAYYKAHLTVLPLHPISSLFTLKGAGDHSLPYLGYIVADVTVSKVDIGHDITTPALILIVPSTNFHIKTPLLLGTNVLGRIFQQVPSTPKQQVTQVWSSQREIHLKQEQSISRIEDVRITKPTTVEASCSLIITGLCRGKPAEDGMMYYATSALNLPGSLHVIRGVVSYPPGHSTTRVKIEVTNSSSKPVTIPARTILCNLQQVKVLDGLPSDEDDVESVSIAKDPFNLAELNKTHTPDEVAQLRDLLAEYHDIFSKSDFDMGHTDLVNHRIELTDVQPLRERHRRIPPSMYQEVKDHIKMMLDTDVIRPSCSPFASPVVLVRKRDGGLRFCVDYRRINARTIRDSYALPRIEETLDALHGAKYFSCLDLKSGYWQVEMAEEHKERTAFTVGPLGLYEFNSMPFGLTSHGKVYGVPSFAAMFNLY